MRQSGVEKRPFGRQKSGRFQEQKPTILRGNSNLEKRYFLPGDLGFPVYRIMGGVLGMCICNDRRWPETYRVMGLQGVEMIILGYNTPSVNSQDRSE